MSVYIRADDTTSIPGAGTRQRQKSRSRSLTPSAKNAAGFGMTALRLPQNQKRPTERRVGRYRVNDKGTGKDKGNRKGYGKGYGKGKDLSQRTQSKGAQRVPRGKSNADPLAASSGAP